MSTYAVLTFGCRVNQADSLRIEADLVARGAVAVAPERADVVVVNSCSVTASADQAARQAVRRVHRLNPHARILVTGCFATRAPEAVAALPGVTRVVDNSAKDDFAGLLDEEVPARADGDGPCGADVGPGLAGRTAWTLRVQTGCDERCSYCIIPRTRGASRSRPVADVARDVADAVARGYRELTITGVHLGAYGRDLEPATTLVALLRSLGSSADGVRFRISSLEPMDCTPELIDLVATAPVMAPHAHLPLQHASDRVLADMRRPYTLSAYAATVDALARRVPGVAIGTDVMVGFPGERDADVDVLCRYLEGSPIAYVHVFPYSDRPGTEASARRDNVPGDVARERGARVRETASRLRARFVASQAGTVHDALTLEDGTLALTGNYLKARIAPGFARNEWVRVRLSAAPGCLEGVVVPS